MAFKAKETVNEYCPLCDEEAMIELGVKEETLDVRGIPTQIKAEVRHCTSCRGFFANVDEEERNFQQAYRKYRERRGMLQPEEIRSIRGQYGLGQRAFSRLLGWGEITVHRYETGALQDEVHDSALRLLKDPRNFQEMFERNKDKVSDALREKVESILPDLVKRKQYAQFGSWLESLLGDARVDIFSGYRRFDLERFENVVFYFCERIPYVTKTKLNKLLWYSDFLNFKKASHSITGLPYLHLQYGPVPLHYDVYLAHFIQEGLLWAEEIDYGEGVMGEILKSLEEPNLQLFTPHERGVLNRVLEIFKNMGARQIADCSHREEGYKQTSHGELISYSWADKLGVAN